MPIDKGQCAKFSVHEQDLQRRPEVIQRLMGKMIVIRCEHNWLTASFDYTVLSELLPRQASGMVPPLLQQYDHADGNISLLHPSGARIDSFDELSVYQEEDRADATAALDEAGGTSWGEIKARYRLAPPQDYNRP